VDISRDITFEYVSRIRYHEDILGIVLKGHLLIEYVLDLFINKGMKQPKPILSDHRSFSFSIKSRLVYETGMINESIFENVVRINRIRNELAHNLSINEGKIDFQFARHKDGKTTNVDLVKMVKSHSNPTKRYLYLLCFGTLSHLQAEYFQRFGTYPLFDSPIDDGLSD
jgi:hypothetical protein